jgi:hypothetical protein
MAKKPPNTTPPLNWPDRTTKEAVREIARLGEIQLEDIRELAVSSDSRSATLFAGLAAVGAALVAAAVAVLQLAHPLMYAVWALVASAACFVAAAFAAACASLPSDFGPRGIMPSKLTHQADELQIIKWSAEATEVKIRYNADRMVIAKRWFWGAYVLVVAGIVVPALFIILAYRFS